MRQKINLISAAFILFAATFVFGQNNDPLAEANQLFETRKYAEAATAYQKIIAQTSDAPTKAKAVFNLGMSYKHLKQLDKALEAFEQIFRLDVNDRESGGNLMQAYRNYRSHAQWQIGICLFGKGDYAGAYSAFRATKEKYPFQSWCGTCQMAYDRDYAVYQAIALEYLGRYSEAIALYWQIYDPRIIELYRAAGQLDDLKAILAKKDEIYIGDRMRRYSYTREKAAEYSPSSYLREFLAIYDLEKAGSWTELIKAASRLAPMKDNGRRNAALEILARHPEQVLPIIKQELNKPSEKTPFYLFYEILGLAATNESIAILKEFEAKEANWWHVSAIVRALSLAGKPGENAINELEPTAKENLKLAIERHKKGELERQIFDVKFPVINVKEKLPTDF